MRGGGFSHPFHRGLRSWGGDWGRRAGLGVGDTDGPQMSPRPGTTGEGDGEMGRGHSLAAPSPGCSSGSPRAPPGRGLLPTEPRGREGNPPEFLKAPRDEGLLTLLSPAFFSSPEKVIFAVEFPFPGEAFLGQVALALAALDAFDVPCPVQDVQ